MDKNKKSICNKIFNKMLYKNHLSSINLLVLLSSNFEQLVEETMIFLYFIFVLPIKKIDLSLNE